MAGASTTHLNGPSLITIHDKLSWETIKQQLKQITLTRNIALFILNSGYTQKALAEAYVRPAKPTTSLETNQT